MGRGQSAFSQFHFEDVSLKRNNELKRESNIGRKEEKIKNVCFEKTKKKLCEEIILNHIKLSHKLPSSSSTF